MKKPDRWMLVKVKGTDPHWRIFATWSGGYLYGDSWRLNSGVERVEDKDEYFDFIGYTGSVYRCSKMGYGVTAYGAGILNDLVKKSSNKMEVIWNEPEDVLELLND